jgi:hypothetical protein
MEKKFIYLKQNFQINPNPSQFSIATLSFY